MRAVRFAMIAATISACCESDYQGRLHNCVCNFSCIDDMSGSASSCSVADQFENITCVLGDPGMGTCTLTGMGTCDEGDPNTIEAAVTANCNASFESCTCSCTETNRVCPPVDHSGACGR